MLRILGTHHLLTMQTLPAIVQYRLGDGEGDLARGERHRRSSGRRGRDCPPPSEAPQEIDRAVGYSTRLVKRLVVTYGHLLNHGHPPINALVVTNDWFWQKRGHHALHGTGTICDFCSGGILERLHLSKAMPKESKADEYEDTAKSMDAYGFEVMLGRLVQWLDNDVPQLVSELGLPIMPKFDSVVLDGDASTNAFVEKVNERALQSSSSAVCAGVRARPCANHLAKNVGKKIGELGSQLNRTCSCPVRRTQRDVPFKTGERVHRGVPNLQHPLVKVLQVGIGAALRGAAASAREGGGRVVDAGIAAVEECLLHVFNVHEGNGPFTQEPRRCRFR
mmetsp:Transcript_23828/g.72932  ORF Transcript_23828/g.72932 Transcript_23828/m.72932 type:complete len:335 (+) Transcript_23828:559-1563(+)